MVTRKLFLNLLCVCFFLIAVQKGHGQWENNFHQAEKLRGNFKYVEALKYYDSTLSFCGSCHDTVLARVYLGMGKSLQNLNDLGEATSFIEKAYQKRVYFKDINTRSYIEISLGEILRAGHRIPEAINLMGVIQESIEDNRELVADSIHSYFFNRLTALSLIHI